MLIKAVSSAAFLNSTYQALPDFLTATEYKDPTDPTNTAVQQAVGEDAKGKNLLEILMARPDAARGFGILITTCGKDNSLIQDLYPVKERLAVRFGRDKFGLDDWQSPSKEDKKEDKDADAEAVMFVDVGGCYGQRTIALKRSLPDLPGRFIVQDLPDTIENAPPAMAAEASKLGIELMPHDFFTSHPAMPAQLARRRLRHDPDVSPPRHDAGVLAAAGARADRATARRGDVDGHAGFQHDGAVRDEAADGGSVAEVVGGGGVEGHWGVFS